MTNIIINENEEAIHQLITSTIMVLEQKVKMEFDYTARESIRSSIFEACINGKKLNTPEKPDPIN